MAENGSELRKIAWTQAFPFVRLFRSLPLALNANRLLLALACVVVSYVTGRILDGIWPSKQWVTGTVERTDAREVVHDEIGAYAEPGHAALPQTLRELPAHPGSFFRGAAPGLPKEEPRTRGVYISMVDFETRCLAAAI